MITENRFEKTFKVKNNLTIHIKREPFINRKFFDKNFNFIAIQNSAFYNLGFSNRTFFLPELYAALDYLTGSSDLWYDNFKGSYSFAFLLKVCKNNKNSNYLYHLYHYRSYIEFDLYQMVTKDDPRDDKILHKPNDDLFSNQDICYFSRYFCGYCLGYIEGAQYLPQPFIQSSESNLLCFGYFNNKYFYEAFDYYEKFFEERNLLQKKIESTLPKAFPLEDEASVL